MLIPAIIATAALTAPADTPALQRQVSSLWQSLSNAPQSKPDIAMLNQIFADDAIVAGIRQKEGQPDLKVQPASDFIASQDRIKPYGFYECEIAREMRVTGGFATVLSLVESRRDPTQKDADFTGINSMQWGNTGNGWQLVSLYYYLPAAGHNNMLLSGTPGQCIN